MGIIRWLMSHLIVVAVVVIVGIGFVFQEEIQAELGTVQRAADSQAKQGGGFDFSRYWPTPERLTALRPVPAGHPKVPVLFGPSEDRVAEARAATKAEAPTPVTQPTPARPVPQPPVASAQPQPTPKPEAKPAPQPMAEPVPQQPTQQAAVPNAPSDSRATWIAARRAFANGDAAQAVSLYRQLVADNPGNADVAGELGNVYMAMGKPQAAAEQYYEAGLRMLQGPNKMRANSVLGVLNQVAPDKAAELRRKIFESMRGGQ